MIFENFPHLRVGTCEKILGHGGFATVRLYKCKGKITQCCKAAEATEAPTTQEAIEADMCNKLFVVKHINKTLINEYTTSNLQTHTDAMEFSVEERNKQYEKRLGRLKEIMLNEYTIGRQLDHPNIIKTLALETNGESIVFEHFECIDLLDYVNAYPDLLHTDCINFFMQILDGVEYLHDMGIAHMDIKLENIVLDTKTRILKLIDFGHSLQFRKLKDTPNTEISSSSNEEVDLSELSGIGKNKNDKYNYIYTNLICGTDAYFPPEYFMRKRFRGDQVDVWCCGILLYQLIYESIPWETPTRKDARYGWFEYDMKQYKKLNTRVFYNRHSDLCYEDWFILQMMFYRSLQIDPDARYDIKSIRNLIRSMKFWKRDNLINF